MTLSDQSSLHDNASINPATLPAEGERRAQRGYMRQYSNSGVVIYDALESGQLLWVGVADRSAGIADDLVLGFDGLIVGHQFKMAQYPTSFTIETLMIGSNGLLKPLVEAWRSLRRSNPSSRIEVRLVINNYPSTNDTPGDASPPHSAAFLDEFVKYPNRTLEEWLSSSWNSLIKLLHENSSLDISDFDQFIQALHIVHGNAANFLQLYNLSADKKRLAIEIANLLPKLITDVRNKDRWSREELLQELGWNDPNKTRHLHHFPIVACVQRNRDTESVLLQTLRTIDQGYVALIGAPGSGKSTLLQMVISTLQEVRSAKYLAFMPGIVQGVGRGEGDNFLEDINAQLRSSGLPSLRLRDDSLHEKREQFGAFLMQAGERYKRDNIRTIIVVDGLDHVPREERPTNSLLAELPLPHAVPNGVTIILGTQHLDLDQLKPAVREQAGKIDRLVKMHPLDRAAVTRIAEVLNLDQSISRPRLYELSLGHPLATQYLIHALLRADETERTHILDGGMEFKGEIESVYASAWRGIATDYEAMKVLGFIARAEAPMPLDLLATIVEEHAIERALMTAGHLLKKTLHGWTIFHNSFRLFILSQPHKRLGKVDNDYSQRIYRELAQLARNAPADSLQQWLELRYHARANDKYKVLELATPANFRIQLAQWRSVSEIESDIRLALLASRNTYDPTIITRLLLCQNELYRRKYALENAEQLPLAMLAAGNLDTAYAFVHDFPKRAYEVVDVLLIRRDFDRAKELFERIEPLSQLNTSRFQQHSDARKLHEFEMWAGRVFHFRDFEQVQQAINYIAVEEVKTTHYATQGIDDLRKHLTRTVVVSVLGQELSTDIHEICKQFSIQEFDFPFLMVEAGNAAQNRGENSYAMELFIAAMSLPGFDTIPNGWRRNIALLAMTTGKQKVAFDVFKSLDAPALSMGDDVLHDTNLSYLTRAVIEHAQLCTMLAKPLPTVTPSKHLILQQLQTHATQIGVLLGSALVNVSSIVTGNVQKTAHSAINYVLQLQPSGAHDFDLTHQVLITAPILAEFLLQIGKLCGNEEYRSVLQEIDNSIYSSKHKNTFILRRKVAIANYRIDGDHASAANRLEPMVGEILESTPSEQIDSLAGLAIAFTSIGDIDRARRLLATVPDHCLGYALAARKDPLYALWSDIFVLANAADPTQSPKRISLLMRQIDGMKQTEGENAAYRLTNTTIDEAMRINARIGFDVAQSLEDWHLIGWSNKIDAIMTGMLRRRPELLFPCITVWCSLCLPFYMEPHYRDPIHVGDFIETAADASGSKYIRQLVSILLNAIEIDSRAHERFTLLKRLNAVASKYGYSNCLLDEAICRWASEAPAPRYSYTPQKYDDIANLDELQRAFEANQLENDHNAPTRFTELAQFAPLEQVLYMYERWDHLQTDKRCRYMVSERLAKAGDMVNARNLLPEYKTLDNDWTSWCQWFNGEKFHYFHALKQIDGTTMHKAAYESFVDSVIVGQVDTLSLLVEIDSILPVISAAPDWPAVWSLLAEQMTSMREFQIGAQFEVNKAPLNDEELLAELLHFAMRLPIAEVQRHTRRCTMLLADQPNSGETVFELTMRRLLAGVTDEPIQALQTILLLNDRPNRFSEQLTKAVTELLNHNDLFVAEASAYLARSWGIAVPVVLQPLSPFYQLKLDVSRDYEDALLDITSATISVNEVMGWTPILRPIAKVLAEAANSDEQRIWQRAAMFIQEWGGIEAFGSPALNRLESSLKALKMKMKYFKPHAWVSAMALRHVAGELRRSGLLLQMDIPLILDQLNTPLPPRPLVQIQTRPREIQRPHILINMTYEGDEHKWVNGVNDDVNPWSDHSNGKVLAEVTQFNILQARWSKYRLSCIRVPQLNVDCDNFLECYKELPAAVWLGQFVPLDNELAPTLIRRLICTFELDAPAKSIIFCPNWLLKLCWRELDVGSFVYIDKNEVIMARIQYWRDSGLADIDTNAMWGEGAYLVLTKEGLEQLSIFQDISRIGVFAERNVEILYKGDIQITKSAKHFYTN